MKQQIVLFSKQAHIFSKRKSSNIVTDVTWDFTCHLMGGVGEMASVLMYTYCFAHVVNGIIKVLGSTVQQGY